MEPFTHKAKNTTRAASKHLHGHAVLRGARKARVLYRFNLQTEQHCAVDASMQKDISCRLLYDREGKLHRSMCVAVL